METPTTESVPTTNVVGYYNPNSYPLSLPNGGPVLYNQNDYVLDAEGRKVNDPYFDRYVTRNGLAKEISPTKVPINYQQKRAANVNPHGFGAHKEFSLAEGTLNAIPAPNTAPAPVIPSGQRSPVTGYTMEQAKKLKIIRETREVLPEEFGPVETADGRNTAEAAGFLPQAYDLPPVRQETKSQPAPALAENTASSAPVVKRDPTSITAADLPEPNLPTADDKSDWKFIAPDGKKFKYRSKLDAYVKKMLPHFHEQYMSRYPKE